MVSEYVSRGRSPKYVPANGVVVLNQRCIRWHGIDASHAKLTDSHVAARMDEAQFIREGDILWNSTGTGTIGRSALVSSHIADQNILVDSHVTIVRPRVNQLAAEWANYWIRTHYVQAQVAGVGSTNQVELNRSAVLEMPVPLPSIDSQRRIVARIDELFIELDDGEAALGRARNDLETYRKSLLKAAITGELTADWRATNPPQETGDQLLQHILAERKARWEADPKNRGKRYKEPATSDPHAYFDLPSGWTWASLDQVIDRIEAGLNPQLKDRGHYQSARISAEYAVDRPYLVAIGGGGDCEPGREGRVLNVAKVSKVYGETPVFYKDPDDLEGLSRWPVATALLDVYEVEGFPRLVEDLGLPDRTILVNAFDLVVRPEEKVTALWEALRDVPLHLVDLPPLVNFREPDRVTLVGSLAPMRISKEEGQRLSKEVQVFERQSELAKLARAKNREAHGGALQCEACGFNDDLDGMFDAHHLVPLMLGVRETTLSDLVVLCPLCHRWAHRKGGGQRAPLPLIELIGARRTTST